MNRRIFRGTWLILAGLAVLGIGCAGVRTSAPMAQADPHRPRFTTLPPLRGEEGFPYRYRFAAQDPDGGSLTFLLIQAPEGAVADDREVVWVPSHRQCLRLQWFTLRVVNAHGVSQDQSWTVTARADVDMGMLPG